MTIALLGTGLLGEAIGLRLLHQQQGLTVWNRSAARMAALEAAGATRAPGPAEAVATAPWVITVLRDGATTASVLEQAGTALAGRTVVQMGTIAPAESRALAQQLAERGCRYLEAPVLGSRPEALAGELQIMVGGPEALVAEAQPLLRLLGPEPRRLGDVGQALVAKLALNQLIATLTHGFSLSLHLVEEAGLDPDDFLALLRGSALYAPTFDKKVGRMRSHHYGDPNFPTAHLRKDLGLFLEEAQAQGLNSSGLTGLQTLLGQASAAGLDGLDYSALHELTGPASGS